MHERRGGRGRRRGVQLILLAKSRERKRERQMMHHANWRQRQRTVTHSNSLQVFFLFVKQKANSIDTKKEYNDNHNIFLSSSTRRRVPYTAQFAEFIAVCSCLLLCLCQQSNLFSFDSCCFEK